MVFKDGLGINNIVENNGSIVEGGDCDVFFRMV